MPHQCTNCGRAFENGSKEMLSGCPDCGGNKFQFHPSGSSAERVADKTAESASTAGKPEGGDDSAEADVEREMPEFAADDERDQASSAEAVSDPARTRADVEREMSELAEDAEAESQPEGVEDQATTAEENQAQRDARSTPTTKEEIDEARRKMAESEGERLSDADDEAVSEFQRPKRGRGAPQGPPPEPPDEEAAEEFSLSGAVGPPEDQPSPNAASERGSEEEAIHGPETDLSTLREELNDQFESIKIMAPGQYELNLMELYDRKEYIISLQEDGRYVVDFPETHDFED
jgi:predicted  nucleic acid-binding Zn-ribbon protein